MTLMRDPDLLDRRALALLALVDVLGRAVDGPVRIEAPGLRCVPKTGGLVAIVAAQGFAEHEHSFLAAPGAPPVGSQTIQLDLTPARWDLAPRRFGLKLPRDPDPAHRDQAGSLFAAQTVTLLPSPQVLVRGSTCILRVTVHRSPDGAFIENALVRAQSDDGKLAAMALTGPTGEAALAFPVVAIAFTGAGATVDTSLSARVTVDVDPALARFNPPAELARARRAAAERTSAHVDPDVLASQFPADFAPGTPFRIEAASQPSLDLDWSQP